MNIEKYSRSYSGALKFSSDRNHEHFVGKILENPKERTAPLVYADWLDENGHSGYADHLRTVVGRQTETDPEGNKYVGSLIYPHQSGTAAPYLYGNVPLLHPSVYLTGHWNKKNPTVGVGVMHKTGRSNAPIAGLSATKNPEYLYFGRSVPVQQAYHIVRSLSELPNADTALEYLQRHFPHLDPERQGE